QVKPGHAVHCVDPIEAVAEKLIAFPRRYSHYERSIERGQAREFDSTLVRHLYDVAQMWEHLKEYGHKRAVFAMQPLFRNLIWKDAREFQHQHPEFVDDAHGEISTFMKKANSDEMAQHYGCFVDEMVYAPKARIPTFNHAVTLFGKVVGQLVKDPSPN